MGDFEAVEEIGTKQYRYVVRDTKTNEIVDEGLWLAGEEDVVTQDLPDNYPVDAPRGHQIEMQYRTVSMEISYGDPVTLAVSTHDGWELSAEEENRRKQAREASEILKGILAFADEIDVPMARDEREKADTILRDLERIAFPAPGPWDD